MTCESPPPAPTLSQLAAFFLKLGTIAFGGPAAHIAMMEDQLVRRRRWISAHDFLDLLAVSNLLPGPTSTELALFIGYRLGKIPGLFLAGFCFILPAFLMVLAIAAGYVRYGHLPAVAGALYGVKPIVIAIIAQAVWRLGKTSLKSPWLAALAAATLLASFLQIPALFALAGAGLIALAVHIARFGIVATKSPPIAAWLPLPLAAASSAATSSSIFLAFLKLGSIVFGSGYVLLAFLRSDLVIHRHWLTETQLLDAVAVGQITPGPVFTTATFIGYLIAGIPGSFAATAGIFTPAFFLVAATGPLVRRLRQSESTGGGGGAALDGLNAASVALMAYVTCILAKTALIDMTTIALALAAAILLFRYRINSTWLIAGGILIGLFFSFVRA